MKRTPGKSDSARRKYWESVIEAARQAPAGVTDYLKLNDIPKNNYYAWFKKLRPDHPEWEDLSKDRERQRRVAKAKISKRSPEEVLEKPIQKAKRRRFSASEKTRVLDETDAAAPGEVAAILRREGLYTSHLQAWRLERANGSLVPQKRGPKANPLAEENKRLEAKLAKAEKKLAQANALIELQKKVSEILKTSMQDEE